MRELLAKKKIHGVRAHGQRQDQRPENLASAEAGSTAT